MGQRHITCLTKHEIIRRVKSGEQFLYANSKIYDVTNFKHPAGHNIDFLKHVITYENSILELRDSSEHFNMHRAWQQKNMG